MVVCVGVGVGVCRDMEVMFFDAADFSVRRGVIFRLRCTFCVK